MHPGQCRNPSPTPEFGTVHNVLIAERLGDAQDSGVRLADLVGVVESGDLPALVG